MTTRTCDGGHETVSTAGFGANPGCRTYLGWSSSPGTVGAARPAPPAAPPRAGTVTQPTGSGRVVEHPGDGGGEEGARAPGYGWAGPASRPPDSEVRR